MRRSHRRATRRHAQPTDRGAHIRLAALLATLLVFGLGSVAAATRHATGTGPALSAHATGSDVSTPVSEWQRGSMPHLYQTDPAWAAEPYAGGTIEKNGCGPTALAMVYVTLTGRTDRGPVEMAAFAERGGYTSDGMTTWSFMTDGASELGLLAQELPADAGTLTSALRAGRPVICSVRPGDFTTTGHFIVLAGLAQDGQLVVHDPNSAERSAQTWDVQRVLDQCANLWAFTMA